MKELKKELNAVTKELKNLTKKTDKMLKRLDRLEKAKTPAKAKVKVKVAKKRVAKKVKRVSATDTVFAIIKRSRKGVDTAIIKKKTGFNDKKVWNTVNMLKRKGKVKSRRMGVYVKANGGGGGRP